MAYIYKNESAFDKVVGSPTGGSITVKPSHYVLGAYFSRYAPATLTELVYDDEEDYDIDFTQSPSVLDGAIDTEDIANEAVTTSKLHPDAIEDIHDQVPVPDPGLTNITETPVTITTYTSLTHEFISGNAPNDTFPALNIDNTRVRTITPLYVQGSMRLGTQRIFLGGDGSTSTGLPCIQAGTGVPNNGDSNQDGSLWIRTDATAADAYLYVKLAGAYVAIGA